MFNLKVIIPAVDEKKFLVDDEWHEVVSFEKELFEPEESLNVKVGGVFRDGYSLRNREIVSHGFKSATFDIPIIPKNGLAWVFIDGHIRTFGRIGERSFLRYDYENKTFNIKYEMVDLVYGELVDFFDFNEVNEVPFE